MSFFPFIAGILLGGAVSCLVLFVQGMKYRRQTRRLRAEAARQRALLESCGLDVNAALGKDIDVVSTYPRGMVPGDGWIIRRKRSI